MDVIAILCFPFVCMYQIVSVLVFDVCFSCIIGGILVPLIHELVMGVGCMIVFSILVLCLLMGPALKSVPSERSFSDWVQQFTKLMHDKDDTVAGTGLFSSLRTRITTSVNQTLLFHTIMSNFDITFLF